MKALAIILLLFWLVGCGKNANYSAQDLDNVETFYNGETVYIEFMQGNTYHAVYFEGYYRFYVYGRYYIENGLLKMTPIYDKCGLGKLELDIRMISEDQFYLDGDEFNKINKAVVQDRINASYEYCFNQEV